MVSMSVTLTPLLEANLVSNKKKSNTIEGIKFTKLKPAWVSPPGLATPGYQAT